jgi:mRNA interferase MazF
VVLPSIGAVILLPFPFSDLSGSKLRLALVLAHASYDDWILCQITSRPYADARTVELTPEGFAAGGLKLVSYVRPGKLFTANGRIILRQAGYVTPQVLQRVIDSIVALLRQTGLA